MIWLVLGGFWVIWVVLGVFWAFCIISLTPLDRVGLNKRLENRIHWSFSCNTRSVKKFQLRFHTPFLDLRT